MRTASSLHMKRRLNAAEDSAVSIAVFFIDSTAHSSRSGSMTWVSPFPSGMGGLGWGAQIALHSR